MPHLRTPDQRRPGPVARFIYVVLFTIVTTVATNYAIIRFSLIPAPVKPAAGKLVAGPVKPKVVRDPAVRATAADEADLMRQISDSAAPAADDSDAMRQVSDSATAVLNTIDAVRTNTGPRFVVSHPGLDTNFNKLTAAANNVLNASGNNPAADQRAVAVFIQALDTTIRNATQISQRPGTPDTVQNAAQVASALGDIRSSLP